ncbi:MAG TPA: hypothetical protein VGD78_20115 [Chthoniobacterales bacterium]
MAARRTLTFLLLTVLVAMAGESEGIRDVIIEPEFSGVLQAEPALLHDGGAKVIEIHGKRYFIAVGVTTVGPNSAQEKLRQVRVGRIQAMKAAAEFIQQTKVSAQEKLTQESMVSRVDGAKSSSSTKTFEESTLTQIEALLKVPPQIGSWKSSDGQLYFCAIGTQLRP